MVLTEDRFKTGRRCGEAQPVRPAFTLTELLIILSIVGLLAVIAVPSFERMLESSRSALCRNQLRQISITLLDETTSGIDLHNRLGIAVPDYTRWEATIVEADLIDLMVCPSDNEPLEDPLEAVKDLYIHQVSWQYGWEQHFDTPLYDVLTGQGINDPQLIGMYKGQELNGGNPVNPLWKVLSPFGGQIADNQAAIAVGWSTILITFTDHYAIVEEYIYDVEFWEAYGDQTGSDHFLCDGPGDNWESETVRDLIGRNYANSARSYAALAKISYGMNSLVQNASPNLGQIYMMDYTDADAILHGDQLDQPFDEKYTNGEVVARHNGRANVLYVDGRIVSLTKPEIEEQYTDPAGTFHH